MLPSSAARMDRGLSVHLLRAALAAELNDLAFPEIVLQLKHSEYDVFFGSEVKIIAIK
jgi:hypothetical protein